jgi:hypothetical protein
MFKGSTSSESDSYAHLVLREKYFELVQTVIEINNEVLMKLVFMALQVNINLFNI